MKGELMKTYIAYFDETGDDGVTMNSSDHFILTSLYMPAESWQQNFEKMRILRRELKDKYGFHVSEEMHTKHFLTDKNPYREYHWSKETKQDIIKAFTLTCIFRKNRALAPHERSAVPLGTDHCPVG